MFTRGRERKLTAVDAKDRLTRARACFEEAYRRQMSGDHAGAITLYRESIALHPTAEAHTFLGWAQSHLGLHEEAIEACRKAIEVDPTFGNPYNDIGSYLIQLGRPEEAIPWLEEAIRAPRYEPRHYPYCNLGRAYWALGQLRRAAEEFERALEIAPGYAFAEAGLAAVRKQVN